MNYCEVPSETYEASIDVEVENVDGTMIISLSTTTYGDYGDDGNISFTSVDMNEVVGADGLANLKELGFSEVQIVGVLSTAYSDTDVDFVSKLSNADEVTEYGEVFKRDPDELSEHMKNGVYYYSTILRNAGLKISDEIVCEQNLERYETFLNGVLYRQFAGTSVEEGLIPCYTEKYLRILIEESNEALKNTRTLLMLKYDNMEAVNAFVPAIHQETSELALYESLYYWQDKCLFCDTFTYQNYFQIENLKLMDIDLLNNDINVAFQFELKETLNGDVHMISADVLNPEEVDSKDELLDYLDKAREARDSIPNYVGDRIITGLSIANPYVGTGIEVLNGLGSVTTLPDAGNTLLQEFSENDYAKKAGKMGMDFYSGIWEVIQAYEEEGRAESEILDDWYNDGIRVSGELGALSQGQYIPNTIIKKAMVEQRGISAMAPAITDSAVDVFEAAVTNNEFEFLLSSEVEDQYYNGERVMILEGIDKDRLIDMFSLVWCGEPYYEDSTMKLSDLTDAQFQECVVLLGKINSFYNYMGEESNFEMVYKKYDIPYLRQ